jgi:hypothetical protein
MVYMLAASPLGKAEFFERVGAIYLFAHEKSAATQWAAALDCSQR